MSLWKRFLQFLRGDQPRRSFELDEGMVRSLQDLAQREKRPPDEIAAHLLAQALQERRYADNSLQRWHELTPREQQIVALICLNYTTRQIATRLMISPETVKTHAHNALYKFGTRSRQELRMALANWDFSNWDDSL